MKQVSQAVIERNVGIVALERIQSWRTVHAIFECALVLGAIFCIPPALVAQARKDDAPVQLLPHMKDLPADC